MLLGDKLWMLEETPHEESWRQEVGDERHQSLTGPGFSSEVLYSPIWICRLLKLIALLGTAGFSLCPERHEVTTGCLKVAVSRSFGTGQWPEGVKPRFQETSLSSLRQQWRH